MSDLTPEDETVDTDIEPPRPRRKAAEGAESSPEWVDTAPEEPDKILVDDEDEPDDEPDPGHTELTAEERESFRDLLTVGRRTKTVTVFDHKVTIASLNVNDEVMIGQATKEFVGSQTFPRAWQSATVAAAIRSVDGESWGQSLFADAEPETLFQEKWDRVRRMYPLVVQLLYKEVADMEVEFAELARKLGKL